MVLLYLPLIVTGVLGAPSREKGAEFQSPALATQECGLSVLSTGGVATGFLESEN
jgi:hypothetical protein